MPTPPGPSGARADRAAVAHRYALERTKRLRADGLEQYVRIEGALARLLRDPFTPRKPRTPRSDHVSVAFIGGGFAGLTTCAKLRADGVRSLRVIDRAGDFGGTWYWNRYPGAQCDTASTVYMPLLEELGHMPCEKYAHGPEILAHCRGIGERYALYEDALFHTDVQHLDWDDAARHWRIRTDRGDDFTANFVGLGVGELHVAKLPGVAGLTRFGGRCFHTSRWDYAYTGGDPAGAIMTGLRDKRVGIIGTGATAVQCVPLLGRDAAELFVFQRTPAAVCPRENEPIDADWFRQIATSGWQQRWVGNFTANRSGGCLAEDLVRDGWTAFSHRVCEKLRAARPGLSPAAATAAAQAEADFEHMERVRARIDAVVRDPATAAKLKPWYGQFCKRPCFHDDYLEAFNRLNTHLIDTDGRGVDTITPTGVVVAGVHYPLDCLIYASGFESGTPFVRRAGFDPIGRGGKRLSERWRDGVETLHGMHVHGFPNLFVVDPLQGANLLSNVTHNFTEAACTISNILAHMREAGWRQVEVTSAAEQAWTAMLLAEGRPLGSADCTPGKYNYEGQDLGRAARLNVGYPRGALAYFEYIAAWRSSSRFEGLAFH